MLVDKCHLADIHKPTRRLKLSKDDSRFDEDRLQALAWIADKMEAGCVFCFNYSHTDSDSRAMMVNPRMPTGTCLCQTGNIGNRVNGECMSVLEGFDRLANNYSDYPVDELTAALKELEYGNTAPFSKYLIQK